MAKKKGIESLTRAQHANYMEWVSRYEEEHGGDTHGAINYMNQSSAEFQQSVINRRWYSADTGKPIKRNILASPKTKNRTTEGNRKMPEDEQEERGIIEEIFKPDETEIKDEDVEEFREPEELESHTEQPADQEVVRADPTGEIANALDAIQKAYNQTKHQTEDLDERMDRIAKILRRQGWDV